MNKTKSMRVRLTDAEWQNAENASIALFGNTNKSQLLRKLLRDYVGMGPDLSAQELQEFREAVKQLTGIARNLNQITARINSSDANINHLTDNTLKRVQEKVNGVNEQLKSYISNTLSRYQGIVNDE